MSRPRERPHEHGPEADEPFQSPLSVAGVGPGGEPYREPAPNEVNPAADPNEPRR